MPSACVIRMRVRDDGPFYRPPRINVEVPRWAIHALRAQNDDIAWIGVNFSHDSALVSIPLNWAKLG